MIDPLLHLSFPVIKCFELDDFQFLSFTGKNAQPGPNPAPVILPLEFLGESPVQGDDFLRFMLIIMILNHRNLGRVDHP
jgi:hypothetical protein